MRTRSSCAAVCTMLAALLAFPVVANAADPAAVTISACKADGLTLAGKVAPTGKSARKTRGALLQVRFQAKPLFGLPRSGEWKSLGKKAKGSGQEVFTGLLADNWIGVLDWRFKKGSRTVLSGTARSQALRIGRAKGKANCTLSEGAKPVDTTPPQLVVIPADDAWHHAPTPVQLRATDDFSGVRSVVYSLDGGPVTQLPNGSSFPIAAEGPHSVQWAATDVAGNTARGDATVKVDAAPPTKPVIQSPPSATANRAPTIQWAASADSGSGIRGYVVTIQRADGSVVTTINAGPSTTSVPAPTLDDNQTYTLTVTAVDDTADSPWATNSDAYAFRVDSSPDVVSVTPPNGTVIDSETAKAVVFTLNLDRAADPATVGSTTVVLHNVDSNTNVAGTLGCAGTPCTQIKLDPNATLAEGRYTLTLNGVKSTEGPAFNAFTANYSVAFPSGSMSATSTMLAVCTPGTASQPLTFSNPQPGETAKVDFDWADNNGGPWTLQAMNGANPAGGNSSVSGNGGSGHATLGPFNVAASITLKLTVACPASTVTLSNMLAYRVP